MLFTRLNNKKKSETGSLETPPGTVPVREYVWFFFMGLQAPATQKANLSFLPGLRVNLLISDPVTEASGRNYELSIFLR